MITVHEPNDRHDFAACQTKTCYVTAEQADRERVRLGLLDLVVFSCGHCSCFHLGHRPGNARKYGLDGRYWAARR